MKEGTEAGLSPSIGPLRNYVGDAPSKAPCGEGARSTSIHNGLTQSQSTSAQGLKPFTLELLLIDRAPFRSCARFWALQPWTQQTRLKKCNLLPKFLWWVISSSPRNLKPS